MKNLALHIMDIFQNSIRAHSTSISLDILENVSENIYRFTIKDNGDGMNPDMVKHVTDPYSTSRTTRKVGMGLALLNQNTLRTGGSLQIESEPGAGTTVVADFMFDNIDRPGPGDIPGAVLLTATANPEIGFVYHHTVNGKSYTFSTGEISEILGDIPISDPYVYSCLHEMITENLKDISL